MFLNEEMRRARAERLLTQEEVAGRICALGVSCTANSIRRWEQGIDRPGCVKFMALCRVLRVAPHRLVRLGVVDEEVRGG